MAQFTKCKIMKVLQFHVYLLTKETNDNKRHPYPLKTIFADVIVYNIKYMCELFSTFKKKNLFKKAVGCVCHYTIM